MSDQKAQPYSIAQSKRLPTYSVSKLAKYIECPAQYRELYGGERETRKRQEATPQRAVGVICHRVLEVAGRARLKLPKEERTPPTKKEFREILQRIPLEIPINDEDWQDPFEITPSILETAADNLDACAKHVSFINTIDVEKKFRQTYGPIRSEQGRGGLGPVDMVEVNGKIDRLDERRDTTLTVIDYKFGYSVMSANEAMADAQTNLYLQVISSLFPGRHVELEYHYLVRNFKLGPFRVDPKYADVRMASIKAAILRSIRWNKFPETPGIPHCTSCHRRAVCGSFQAFSRGGGAPLVRSDGANLAEFHRLKTLEKVVKEGLDELKPVINEAVSDAKHGVVSEDGYAAKLVARSATTYPDHRKLSISIAKVMCDKTVPPAPKHEPIPSIAAELAAVQPTNPTPEPDGSTLEGPFEGPVAPPKSAVDVIRETYDAVVAELEAARAKLRKAEEGVRLVKTAFDVAVAISKPQSGLVDAFVGAMPIDLVQEVSAAAELEAVNSGTYYISVDKIEEAFVEEDPTPEEEAAADAQAAFNPYVGGSKPQDVPASTPTAPVTASAPPASGQTDLFGSAA